MDANKILKVYTDGSCQGNPGRGAYAYIVVDVQDKIVRKDSQVFVETTNNRMELIALIAALMWLQTNPLAIGCINKYEKIEVTSDSEYLVRGIGRMRQWKKNDWFGSNGKKVLNIDLWKKIYNLMPNFKNIIFTHIKGHSGNEFNDRVDCMAVAARNNCDNMIVDSGYINIREVISDFVQAYSKE